VDVRIINYWDVQNTFPKSVLVILKANNFLNYFRLGPDLS